MLTASRTMPVKASPVPRVLVTAVEILVLAVLAFLLARAIWFIAYGAYAEPFEFAEPEAESAASEARLQVSAQSFDGLFSEGLAGSPGDNLDALPETRLGLRLFGVRTGSDPETGTAIIEAGANGQRTYAVGQAIANDAELAAVYADRIVIRRAGVREVLFLREEAARTSGASPSPAALDSETLITDLALQPYFEAGNLLGFRVNADSTVAAVAALNLQRGDVIVEINGRAMPQDAEAAARLLPGLRQSSSLQLTVRRDGERVTLDISR